MSARLLPFLPAALTPAAMLALERAGASDLLSGTVAGMLIGLAIVGLVRGRLCRTSL